MPNGEGRDVDVVPGLSRHADESRSREEDVK